MAQFWYYFAAGLIKTSVHRHNTFSLTIFHHQTLFSVSDSVAADKAASALPYSCDCVGLLS